MDARFWTQRWEDDNTPWHEGKVNAQLARYVERMGLSTGARVLVPLCGKAEDMWWLHQHGFTVLGVELSVIALRAFMVEHGLDHEEHRDGRLVRLASEGIRLLGGDFFDVGEAELAEVGGVYDRAALIALPETLRGRYVRWLLDRLPAAAPILLVSLVYPAGEIEGPPFSVAETEVRALFEPERHVDHLGVEDVIDGSGLQKRGLTELYEHTYLIHV